MDKLVLSFGYCCSSSEYGVQSVLSAWC